MAIWNSSPDKLGNAAGKRSEVLFIYILGHSPRQRPSSRYQGRSVRDDHDGCWNGTSFSVRRGDDVCESIGAAVVKLTD
jgi:hypothetical protein